MYTPRSNDAGQWYIGHWHHPGLAWSHAAQGWVPLSVSAGHGLWPVSWFDSEEQLEAYVNENHLYPRRD